MATKLVTFKNKAGDIYLPQTTAAQVKRGASDVATDLTAVETLAGNAIPSTQKGAASGVAPLGADGKIAATYLPASALTAANKNVADIAALTALSATDAPLNTFAFVADATGDSTVTSGWGLYTRIATTGGTLTDWKKVAEGEGVDVAMVDQTARDNAAAAQGDVDDLTEAVGELGTVRIFNSGDDVSAASDTDLIIEVTGTV